MLYTISGNTISRLNLQGAVTQLERGTVIFLPELSFKLTSEEQVLYTDTLLSGKNKNISYNVANQTMSHLIAHEILTKSMMARYVEFAKNLVQYLFPVYQTSLKTARTSFRPAEAYGREAASYRKDDTRLHVDAFPATPNQGQRLLRVFTNVNPQGKPRVWKVGEPFEKVVNQFAEKLYIPFALKKYLLQFIGVTKGLRCDYDALMLQLHDRMKKDLNYQRKADQERIEFPAGSTWIVFTDQVSHAALAGQFCLEQTFLLPVSHMQDPFTSPLKILEKRFNCSLLF